jgi:hypothetical protein
MKNAAAFSQKVNDWVVLAGNLVNRLKEMPFLQSLYEELVSIIEEAQAIVTEQESARSAFRVLVRKRQDVEQRGNSVRGRIGAHLRAELGFQNEELIQFGLLPLPRTTRRRTTTEEPSTPPPAEPPAPTPVEPPPAKK